MQGLGLQVGIRGTSFAAAQGNQELIHSQSNLPPAAKCNAALQTLTHKVILTAGLMQCTRTWQAILQRCARTAATSLSQVRRRDLAKDHTGVFTFYSRYEKGWLVSSCLSVGRQHIEQLGRFARSGRSEAHNLTASFLACTVLISARALAEFGQTPRCPHAYA